MQKLAGTVMLFALCCLTEMSIAGDIELAKDFYAHNLYDRAKETLLNSLHDKKSNNDEKAQALFLLGEISFEEKHYKVALRDWELLVKSFPQSPQAKVLGGRLRQLRDVFVQVSENISASSLANSYISNGDFFARKEHKVTIDTSWLPTVELACEWYDRVIEEFPGSRDAELAYDHKLSALFGRKSEGQYDSPTGAEGNFVKYMPQILATFEQYEKSYPESVSLQSFRYRIAQRYWGAKSWAATREWLQKVISAGQGSKTFYTELATARLRKIEY